MNALFSLALAQINPTVGDIAANIGKIRSFRFKAVRQGVDVLVMTELVVSGYPPEDLVCHPTFLERIKDAVAVLAQDTLDGGPAMIVGTPWMTDAGLCNAAVILDKGCVQDVIPKHHLPTYGVFDEGRVFVSGPPVFTPVMVRGVRLGLMICEDMWHSDVSRSLAAGGAEILVVLNGSPFESAKSGRRLAHARKRVAETGVPLAYVNQVGGQDELVFDGGGFVVGTDGSLRLTMPFWREELVVSRWRRVPGGAFDCVPCALEPVSDSSETLYQAMMLGLRDYVVKNGFPGVILGLSGGIDSALSAAVAVDALGADRVWGVMMPSPYTSPDSLRDADDVANMLGIRLDRIDIHPVMGAFDSLLAPFFQDRPHDITEENIQSRARGMTLMALSNKFGPMVLSTGNKSEISVGYATLYGDMCGGYSVLKDLYKTKVFALSRWRNQFFPCGGLGVRGQVMPERVITKPPTAELRPDQKDEDSLPPYDVLDAVLERLIERDMSLEAVVADGFCEETVSRIWRMLNRVEYKRRQAPPGVKLTERSFGRDRRYPVTNGFIDPR